MPVTVALYVGDSVIINPMFILNITAWGSDAPDVVRKKYHGKPFLVLSLFVCLFVLSFFIFHRSFFFLWVYLHFLRLFWPLSSSSNYLNSFNNCQLLDLILRST